MHPTALLVLANDRIADLVADTARIRLASQAHRTTTSTATGSRGAIAIGLRTIVQLVLGAARPERPATAD